MKWNEVTGLVLAFLFLSTLFTFKGKPTLQESMTNYYWEMYEPDGTKTAWNEKLIIKFWKSTYDIQYNDSSVWSTPYFVPNDSTIYMYNTFFFNDTTFTRVEAHLFGENDMLMYPVKHWETNHLKVDEPYIYMKRKIPYQY